jgi:hypothetical protein
MFVNNNCEQTFEKLFLPLSGRVLKYVEIGVWTGQGSLAWMLRNVLTHRKSSAIGIDTWEMAKIGRQKRKPEQHPDKLKYVADGIANSHHNCQLIQGASQDVLPTIKKDSVSILFIDGDHSPPGVLRDLVMGFEIVARHGIIVVDNMANTRWHDVPTAIDSFLDSYWGCVKVLDVYPQQWACVKLRNWDKYETSVRRPANHPRYSQQLVPRENCGRRHL